MDILILKVLRVFGGLLVLFGSVLFILGSVLEVHTIFEAPWQLLWVIVLLIGALLSCGGLSLMGISWQLQAKFLAFLAVIVMIIVFLLKIRLITITGGPIGYL